MKSDGIFLLISEFLGNNSKSIKNCFIVLMHLLKILLELFKDIYKHMNEITAKTINYS